jgi:preprotein translocase subunit SecG
MIGLAIILFILCLLFLIILTYRDYERTKKEEDASSQKTKRRNTGEK